MDRVGPQDEQGASPFVAKPHLRHPGRFQESEQPDERFVKPRAGTRRDSPVAHSVHRTEFSNLAPDPILQMSVTGFELIVRIKSRRTNQALGGTIPHCSISGGHRDQRTPAHREV